MHYRRRVVWYIRIFPEDREVWDRHFSYKTKGIMEWLPFACQAKEVVNTNMLELLATDLHDDNRYWKVAFSFQLDPYATVSILHSRADVDTYQNATDIGTTLQLLGSEAALSGVRTPPVLPEAQRNSLDHAVSSHPFEARRSGGRERYQI